MLETQPITLSSLLATENLLSAPLDTHIWVGQQAFTYMKKKFVVNADFDQREHRSLAAMQVVMSINMPDWDVEIGRIRFKSGIPERVVTKRFTLKN